MGDGPVIKKPRATQDAAADFDFQSLENLLPDDLLVPDAGDNPGRPHENGLNGIADPVTAYSDNPSSFTGNNQNHAGTAATRNVNLTQLLASARHSQPIPLGLPLDNITSASNMAPSPALGTPPPPGQPGGQQQPGSSNALMNPRASPAALQNATSHRQSPQLPRTTTPGGHPNLQFTTNGGGGGGGGPPVNMGGGNAGGVSNSANGIPAGMNIFHNNMATYNGTEVSFHGHPQQQQPQQLLLNNGRMPFPNGHAQMNGQMGGGGYPGQNGSQPMMNGPSMMMNGPTQVPGGLARTSSAGNLAVHQQQQPAMVRAGAPPNQQIRMPNNSMQQHRPNMGPRPGMPSGSMNGPMGPQVSPGQNGVRLFSQQQQQQPNSFSPPPPLMNLNPVSPPMPNMMQQQQGSAGGGGMQIAMQNHAGQQQQQLALQQPMSVGPVQNQLSPPSVGDPEKRKIIQQQLVLLLHAHKCQRREQVQPDGTKRDCTLPHCRTMKNVLTHMTQCQAGKACQMPHCASSRQIIQHWKTCARSDCPVCLPLKQASDRQRPPGFEFPPGLGPMGQPMMQPAGAGGAGVAGNPAVNGNFPAMNGGGMNRPPGPANFGSGGNTAPGNQGMLRNSRDGAGIGIGNYQLLQGGGQQNVQQQFDNVLSPQSEGAPLTQAATLQRLMAPPTEHSILSTIQFSPQTVPTKDWHQSINMDLRNHLIHKLVQAIFPYKDPSALQDKRMNNLISYARKVEADMYETANTREEYYQFLAEKIYKIQKELEEKRLKRQNEKKPALLPNGQLALPDLGGGGIQGLAGFSGGGATAASPRGPPGLAGGPGVRPPMRPSAPGDFNGNNNALNDFMQRGGGQPGLNFPAPSPLGGNNGGSYQNGFGAGGMGGGYGTPQHQTNFDIMMQPKNEFGQEFRPNSAMSVGGGSLEGGQSQDDNGNYQMKQEPADGVGTSPKHQLPSDSQNSVKSEQESDHTGREEVPMRGSSSPSQALSGAPTSVQSSTTDSDTLKSEQDGAVVTHGGESSNETKMVLTGKDGKTPKKVHAPEELLNALTPLIDRLFYLDPEGVPFREPVNPEALYIPDYLNIIKTPMDLSTIKDKLENGKYDDPWQFSDDIWLMFTNAWTYNRKGSKVFKFCTKLSEVFESEVDPVMQRLGYCCGRRYVFQPQVLCCYGKQLCTIPRDTGYWSYQNRYTYCQRCFDEISGDTVTLGDDPSVPMTNIKKDLFQEMKNDQVDYEPFVHCKLCGRKDHQICVLHMDQIWPEGFVCECCLKQQNARRKDNRFSSKKLPPTKLGQHIENHINSYLQNKHVTEAGEVTIRVLSSCDKTVEIKPGMKHKFGATKEIAETFPYRTKAIFAFEDIDGTDVCFFGMHVQEYGSDCPPPNSRRVYIAYLDSVHFFRPKHVRTAVYHEILLSYINYCKNLGYTMAHIWACPPSEGDDYVFHSHPPEQKIPKPKRLQEWYRRMLDKGITDGIITEYKDILKHSMEDSVSCATELPYFEGDFWPNVMEECIKEVEQLELKEKEERHSLEDSDDSDDTSSEPGKGKKRPKKGQSSKKQKGSSKSASRKSNKKGLGGISANANILTQKIFNTMDKHKDVFFVVRLHPQQRQTSLPEIVDPDPLISCELMDGRDAFLTMSREKHYEFSSLRRTKFSTLAMLYELHTQQGQDRFVYTCNSCKAHVETRYQCSVCDDFDLCVPCYEKEGHPHKMDRLGMDLDDGSSAKDSKAQGANPKESRLIYLQKFIQSLVHTSQCRDANCRNPSCAKMKRFIAHTRGCKKKTNGQCPVCKQLIALCCYHAKQCNETKCVVPFCTNIKAKIKTQRQQQDLQRAHFNRRRNALMNQQIRMGPGQPPGSQDMSNNNHTSVPSPGSNNNVMPHGPVGGMKTQPSASALDAVRSVQEHARYQAQQIGGKGGMPQFGNQQFGGGKGMNMPGGVGSHPGLQSGMVGGGKGIAEQHFDQHFMTTSKPLMPTQSPPMGNRALPPVNQRWDGGAGGLQNPNGANMGPRGGVPNMMVQQGNQGTSLQPGQNPQYSVAHTRLLEALRQPESMEQKQVVTSILRSNPQLMALFLRNRNQQANMQQQGGGGILGGGGAVGDPGVRAAMMMQPQQQQQQPGGQTVAAFNRMPQPPLGQQQQRPPIMYAQNMPPNAQQQQQQQQFMQQGGSQMMNQLQQPRMQAPAGFPLNQSMGVNFSQAGPQQPSGGVRPRFAQAQPSQPQQQQQFLSNPNMGMGPPNSFSPHGGQQMTPQLQQQQSLDMNFALQQQQQQRIAGGGGPIRSPASALPVRSPQAQASPSLLQQQQGRQSTPGPGPSPSPRPLSGNAAAQAAAMVSAGGMHPSVSGGYMDSVDVMGGGGGQHGMQNTHGGGGSHGMGGPGSIQGGGGHGMDSLSSHQINMNGPMGMSLPSHYAHHQPASLTPQDHLNKFVDNL